MNESIASYGQLLLLPPKFQWELHRAMSARFGYARMALSDLLEAAGTLARLVP